jgi:nitrogen fixation protein NifU and related proteins
MDLYLEEVLDHHEHPRNRGRLTGDTIVSGEGTNASCGDSVLFDLQVRDGKVVAIAWEGTGCAIAMASASKLSEYLVGKLVSDIAAASGEQLAQAGVGFSVNPGRLKCLLLPVVTVQKLVA